MRDYFEVALPRRPPKNPQPCVVSCGDCGACVLAGLLGITVEQAYEQHESGHYYRGPLDTEPAKEIPKRSALNYHSMRRTLTAALYAGQLDRAILDTPLWVLGAGVEMNGAFGVSAALQSIELRAYWLAMFDAGYYGVCQVVMNGGGIDAGVDHWVMLCGFRRRRGEGSCIEEEVLIGDSALSQPQERWVSVNDFLRNHGGFMAFFARPSKN